MTPAPTKFDQLYAEAVPAVRAGDHTRESPPREGGRWPLSVVLEPDTATGRRLHDLTQGALQVAGPGHWATGALGSAHVTVTSVEDYRASVPECDAAVAAWVEALRRAAEACGPVRLAFTGLTLTRGTVMLAARSVDGSAEAFRAALRTELIREVGERGWSEWDFERDIWYANLIHFAADVPDPEALLEWVDQRRELDLDEAVIDAAQLWRYTFTDHPGPPVPLARHALTG